MSTGSKPHVNGEDVANLEECLEQEAASWYDELYKCEAIVARLPVTGAAGSIRADLLRSLDTVIDALLNRRVVP